MTAFALNFYSPVVEAQLRSHRKTATIRLGDKSRKYQKGMIVSVLVGARFGPREHVFDAVIDKVEVKRLGELSPREIEHDNPEVRRPEEMAHFLSQLYNREVTDEDVVTVIRFSAIKPAVFAADLHPEELGSRSRAPHSSQSTAKVDENGAEHDGQRWIISPPQAGHSAGISLSNSSNQRRAAPHWRQIAVQSPSTLRRSSRSQSEALPIVDIVAPATVARAPVRSRNSPGVRSAHLVRVDDGMSIARVAEPSGSLQEAKEWGLDREDLLGIYRNMLMTRGVEERGHILYKQGKIPGSFYTGRGNEASSVAVGTAMGRNDVGTPLHRDMGVHITRGVEPWRILANYMGRADGPAKGRDGNVHMADIQLGLVAMVSHLPAMMPVAVGCALAFRIREEKRVAVELVRRGRLRARRRARGDELRRRPAAAGGLRLRQQQLGVLDPRPTSSTPSSTSPTAQPPTASRASSSTAPTRSPSTARRSARSRRHGRAAARR